MKHEILQRKTNRLENRDYSDSGAYFLTICTAERRNHFWYNVGATIGRPQDVKLSPSGMVVDEAIKHIPLTYPSISLESYVIMPDHIHLLLRVRVDESGRPMVAPTMSRIVKQLKGLLLKRLVVPYGKSHFLTTL